MPAVPLPWHQPGRVRNASNLARRKGQWKYGLGLSLGITCSSVCWFGLLETTGAFMQFPVRVRGYLFKDVGNVLSVIAFI